MFHKRKYLYWVLPGLVIILLFILVMKNSTVVRLNSADSYIDRGETKRAMHIYEAVSRRESLLANNPVRKLFKISLAREYDINLLLADHFISKQNIDKTILYLNKLTSIKPLREVYSELFRLQVQNTEAYEMQRPAINYSDKIKATLYL